MKNLFILMLLLISTYTNADSCGSLKEIKWILGLWGYENQSKLTTEHWRKVSDLTIEGEGNSFINGKLKDSESLRIVTMSNAVFYIAKVDHNSLPVAFKMVQCTRNHAIFENFKHDFPKRIVYKAINKDRMKVIVSDGQDKGFTINYIRSDSRKE